MEHDIKTQVHHKFALNGNSENPNCYGIAGVLEAYRKTIQSADLCGPPMPHPSSTTWLTLQK